ncbi:MAG: hypothetical protein NTW99_08245 [Chloroflexi bacterium]|nr:hypothetical protein [Chloroflexota bacterium]
MTITRDARLEVQTVGRKWMGSAWLTPDLFFPKIAKMVYIPESLLLLA